MNRRQALKAIGALAVGMAVPKGETAETESVQELKQLFQSEIESLEQQIAIEQHITRLWRSLWEGASQRSLDNWRAMLKYQDQASDLAVEVAYWREQYEQAIKQCDFWREQAQKWDVL